MTPFDGLLSGTRGALLARNLVLRLLNRPRLKVRARIGYLWLGSTPQEAPLSLIVSVANPSPHPLVLSHIGVILGNGHTGFPDELKAILGPIAQFDSRTASMSVQVLEHLSERYGGPLPVREVRVVVTDGLGKEWRSPRVNVPDLPRGSPVTPSA